MQMLQAMHIAELSNAQSRTLYSHLGDPVHQRSPKLAKRPGSLSCGRMYDMRQDVLYCTRTIAVISPLPLIATFERLLRALHRLAVAEGGAGGDGGEILPLESYVYNIIYKVPLPPPGRSLKLTIPGGVNIVCQRPSECPISY